MPTDEDITYSPTLPPGVAVSRSLVWDGAVVVHAFCLFGAALHVATLSYSEVLDVAAVTLEPARRDSMFMGVDSVSRF